MSHQKLKQIKIDKRNMKVLFMEKCNNDTAPFRQGESTIPTFVHYCWGNVYQHNNSKINAIISEMEEQLKQLVISIDDLWFTFSNSLQYDRMNEIRQDLRDIFFRTCDKINNL
jgi:hypothetical protein